MKKKNRYSFYVKREISRFDEKHFQTIFKSIALHLDTASIRIVLQRSTSM